MRPTTKSRSVLLAACVCLAVALGVVPGSALAQSTALLRLTPQPAMVGMGQTAAVEVRIENVVDLYGLDIRLEFDPAAVEVVDEDAQAEGLQIRPGGLLKPDFVVRNLADNTAGTVWFALTQLNPSEAVTGSGVAFTVIFRGKRAGASTPLTISYQKLAARSGDVIPASQEDGEIRVVENAQAPPTPTLAPTLPPPTLVLPAQPPATAVPAQPTAAPALTLEPAATAVPPTAAPTPTTAPALTAKATATQQTAVSSPTSAPATAVPTLVPATPTPSPTDARTGTPSPTDARTGTPVQVAAVAQAVPTLTRAAPTATPVPSAAGGRSSSWLVYALLFVVGFAGAAWFLRSRRGGA